MVGGGLVYECPWLRMRWRQNIKNMMLDDKDNFRSLLIAISIAKSQNNIFLNLNSLILQLALLYSFIMINKNLSRTPEPKPNQQSPNREIANSTTIKQKQSVMRFQQQFEIQRHSDPFIEQDRMIEPQNQHIQNHSPVNESVSSPRRSLIRQKQLWAAGSDIAHNNKQQLLFVSDQYYNENVPNQTLLFLEKIRGLLRNEEESLHSKRKAKLQTVINRIRTEFSLIRDELTRTIDEWCRRTEEQELQYFIHKGELSISGEIEELTARVTTRREEIQRKINQLNEGMSISQLVNREEVLKRNRIVKKVVKEVWSRDYELEVSQLQEQVYGVKHYQSNFHFEAIRGQRYKTSLQATINEVLGHFQQFKYVQKNEPSPPPKAQKIEEQSLSPPSSAMRQQILQSLLQERRREVDEQSRMIINSYNL